MKSRYNMVKTLDYFYFRNHLCITFELLSINLYEFIKNNVRRRLAPPAPQALLWPRSNVVCGGRVD
eukprot:COSAG01_NODE_4858_length_4678_cov_12.236078_2_plen_66_part_00